MAFRGELLIFVGLVVILICLAAEGKKSPCGTVLNNYAKKAPKYGRVRLLPKQKQLVYSCRKGYKLIGNVKRSCKKAKLTGKLPKCFKNVSCPIPRLRNGMVNGTDFTVGERIKYQCNYGYRMASGDVNSKCLKSGRWSNEKPKCEKIVCSPAYTSLRNGDVTVTDPTNSLGAKVYFECNQHYELVGSDTLTCTEFGRWDRSRPYCTAIRCPELGHLPNGFVVKRGREIGKKVTFICSSGYRLLGSRERTCQTNRRWDGSLAVCDSGNFHCPTLGKPIKGEKHGDQYDQGDVVRFSCDDGYVLRGSPARVCLRNGTWNGTEAYCIDEQDARYKGENETARLLRANLVDTVMEYTCTDGNTTCNATLPSDVDARARAININEKSGMDLVFVLDGSSSIKKDDFELGLKFVTRLVKMIGADRRPGLPVVRFAAVTYGSEAHLQFNLGDADVDSTEKLVKRIGQIRRAFGGTASEAALEEVLKVIVPMSDEGRKRFMIFITDGRSNIGASPERKADELKDVYGFEIYAIGVGNKINDKELAAVASKPYEEHVIEVRNHKALDEGLKKAAEVKIDYTPCGQRPDNRGRIVGGTISRDGAWPWMARIYRIKIKNGKEENVQVCGAALIRRRWLLTAAHCFFGGCKEIGGECRCRHDYSINPHRFEIALGDRDTTLKEPSQQDRKAEQIFPKDDYDKCHFVNDIALIKLNKKAKLSKYVRMLCLPNKDLAVPGEAGNVAGWGTTEARAPDDKSIHKASRYLQESAFTVQEDSLCRNKTEHVVNSNTTFCAGNGKGGNDTCQGDSGGPFVRVGLMNAQEKDPRWMAAGIVSWGEGCAHKDKYGYYTRVWPFVDWIEKTIKDNSDPGDDEDDSDDNKE